MGLKIPNKCSLWIKENRVPLLFLAGLWALSLGIYYAPILFTDDWPVILLPCLNKHYSWIDWPSRRPFIHIPFNILCRTIGIHINLLYLVNYLIRLLNAWLLYGLVKKFFPRQTWIPLAAALIYSIYPVDLTRGWLTMINVQVVWLLGLMYALLLYKYAETGRLFLWISAILILVFSLGIYEAHLGLAIGWAVFLAIFPRNIRITRRAMLMSLIGVGLAFGLWRTVGFESIQISDPYIQWMELNPSILFTRLMVGFKIFIKGWTDPLKGFLGLRRTDDLIFVLLAFSILMGVATAFLLGLKHKRLLNDFPRTEKNTELIKLAFTMLVGLGFMVMGFLPIITVLLPNFDVVASRANIFAIPGAAVVIAASAGVLAVLISRRQDHLPWVVMMVILPFLAIGVYRQTTIQREAKIAWDDQINIWHQTFKLAPGLTDNTQVFYVLPGFAKRGFAERLPLTSRWEIITGLQVMYKNGTLLGDIYFPDSDTGDDLKPLENGVEASWPPGFLTPYKDAVFFLFDRDTKKLKLVTNLQSELGLTWETPDYDPYSHITSTEPSVELRRLVGYPSR